MKKAVVINIQNGKATLMRPDGRFVTTPAQMGWKKGALVTLPATRQVRILPPIAACLALFIVTSLLLYGAYFREVSWVSVDTIASYEMGVNRIGRVVSARNMDGGTMDDVHILHQNVETATLKLLSGGMDEYAIITVTSEDAYVQATLIDALIATINVQTLSANPATHIDIRAVNMSLLSDAHDHYVTAGKYLTQSSPAVVQTPEPTPLSTLEPTASPTVSPNSTSKIAPKHTSRVTAQPIRTKHDQKKHAGGHN